MRSVHIYGIITHLILKISSLILNQVNLKIIFYILGHIGITTHSAIKIYDEMYRLNEFDLKNIIILKIGKIFLILFGFFMLYDEYNLNSNLDIINLCFNILFVFAQLCYVFYLIFKITEHQMKNKNNKKNKKTIIKINKIAMILVMFMFIIFLSFKKYYYFNLKANIYRNIILIVPLVMVNILCIVNAVLLIKDY